MVDLLSGSFYKEYLTDTTGICSLRRDRVRPVAYRPGWWRYATCILLAAVATLRSAHHEQGDLCSGADATRWPPLQKRRSSFVEPTWLLEESGEPGMGNQTSRRATPGFQANPCQRYPVSLAKVSLAESMRL